MSRQLPPTAPPTLTNLTITAQNATSAVAGIDLSNLGSNPADTAHGDLVLIAGAGTRTGSDITFVAGTGTTLNAARVELRQDTDFNATRPVTILIGGTDPGLTGNPITVTISGDTQVLWAAPLITRGDLTMTDLTGIELNRARLVYTGDITINAGAMDITFAPAVGDTITWEAVNITITAGSIVLGDRTLTIITESVITEDGITEGGTLTLNVANITSTGDLSLTGETIQIGLRGVDTSVELGGAAITLTSTNGIQIGRFTRGGDFRTNNDVTSLAVNASGMLTIAADITVADGTRSGGDITLTGGSIAFGAAARTITGTAIRLTGAATGTADLTLIASGTVRTDNSITLTGAGNNLTLMSTEGGVRILADISTGGALTLSGATEINLRGGAAGVRALAGAAITLTGAARSDRALTITAGGILTINNDITLTGADLTLTLSGMGAIVTTGRPTLTASTVSLTQIDAFAAARPFRFGAVSSLVFITAAAQDVHTWMIALNSDLTITSPARVRVRIAIGASVPGRNLGAGNITLESTGADIRIQENISTTGNITLDGATGINFNGRRAKTLSGAIITLDGGTGDVVSNRDLTIIASGALTLNNNITTTASNLVLTGGMITLGSALTLSGGDVTLIGDVTSSANLTLTATGILTFIGDSIAIGSGNLSLTGATIRLGRASRSTDMANGIVNTTTLTGGAITLTAAGGITVGRFASRGRFLSTRVPALMVTASGVLTIAANITSVADITLNAGTGGIVIGTATGSSALTWRGSDITLTGAVTTASTTTASAT